jgi:hypothetical protein
MNLLRKKIDFKNKKGVIVSFYMEFYNIELLIVEWHYDVNSQVDSGIYNHFILKR